MEAKDKMCRISRIDSSASNQIGCIHYFANSSFTIVLCFVPWLILFAGCRGNSNARTTTSLSGSKPIVEEAIKEAIPNGMEIMIAKRNMEAAGFKCAINDDGGGKRLYCVADQMEKWPVSRHWQVIVRCDGDTVKEVEISSHLVGP